MSAASPNDEEGLKSGRAVCRHCTGSWPMLSQPEKVASVILDAVRGRDR